MGVTEATTFCMLGGGAQALAGAERPTINVKGTLRRRYASSDDLATAHYDRAACSRGVVSKYIGSLCIRLSCSEVRPPLSSLSSSPTSEDDVPSSSSIAEGRLELRGASPKRLPTPCENVYNSAWTDSFAGGTMDPTAAATPEELLLPEDSELLLPEGAAGAPSCCLLGPSPSDSRDVEGLFPSSSPESSRSAAPAADRRPVICSTALAFHTSNQSPKAVPRTASPPNLTELDKQADPRPH